MYMNEQSLLITMYTASRLAKDMLIRDKQVHHLPKWFQKRNVPLENPPITHITLVVAIMNSNEPKQEEARELLHNIRN